MGPVAPDTTMVRYSMIASTIMTMVAYTAGNMKKLKGTAREKVMNTAGSMVPQCTTSEYVIPMDHRKKRMAQIGLEILRTKNLFSVSFFTKIISPMLIDAIARRTM